MSNLNIDVQVAGRFKLEAFKTDADGNEIPGTRRVAADWFSNLITDAGLNLMGTGGCFSGSNGAWFYACRVGSGSTTPAVTDTALVAQVASTTTKQTDTTGVQGAAPYFGWRRITYRFSTGTAAGNLSEVGIFTVSPSGGTCCSRALIVDGGGTPTTITVLSDETLDVTYEFRMYPPTGDVAGTVTISGITYNTNARAANVTKASSGGDWVPETGAFASSFIGVLNNTSFGSQQCCLFVTSTLGAITSQPSGTEFPPTSGTAVAYTNGNFYRDHTLTWELAQGPNSGGAGSILLLSQVGAYQVNFVPNIPKDATKRMTLDIRMSWSRYTP